MTAVLRWGASTHEGRVRTENEDSFVAEPLIFGVADGMGGHQAGEVASALAAGTLRDRLGHGSPNLDVVVAAVVEANASIFQSANRNAEQRGMGTTLTALAMLDPLPDDPTERMALVNVGDSRTYRYRAGQLVRATVDHSYVQELVATGHITEVEARTHPRRNIVTRALGIEPTVRVDSWVLPVVRGDRYILCSDGLVDEVPDHEIMDIAGGVSDPQTAADELVAMANRHGGRDNITVIVVDVVEGADPPLPGAGPVDDGPGTAEMPVTAAPDSPASGIDEAATTLPVSGTDPVAAAAPWAGGASSTTVEAANQPVAPKRRRFTAGTFLFVFGLALIATVTITLIVVAINNSSDDDDRTPVTTTILTTTTVPESTTTQRETNTTTATTESGSSTPGGVVLPGEDPGATDPTTSTSRP